MERDNLSFYDLSKRQRGYKAIFDNVSEPYQMSTLNTIIDFIEDTTSFNQLIREQTPEEAQFISAIPNFASKESLYCILPQQVRHLVRELARTMKHNFVTLRVVVRKGHGRHRLKDVELFKTKVTPRGNRNKKKAEDLYAIVNKQVEDYDPKEMFLKSLSRHSTAADRQTPPPPPPPPPPKEDVTSQLSWRQNMGIKALDTSSEQMPKENGSNSGSGSKHRSNSNYSLKTSGIQWQAAGSTGESCSADRTTNASHSNERRSRRGTIGARNSKLLEALATPLDCLPATRMMQKMGWTGGALGARGEGITEPIMPALDIVQGAGFGHSRGQSQGKRESRANTSSKNSSRSLSRSPADFRITVLENLLQLLKNDEDEIDFHLRAAAGRKQIRFIDTALKSFNGRKNVGLNTPEEKELIAQIRECFEDNDTLFIEVEYANSYRTVTLIKTKRENLVIKSRRRGRSRAMEVENDSSDSSCSEAEPASSDALVYYTKTDLRSIRAGLKKSEQFVGPKAVKALTSRVAIFQAILKFVMSEQDVGTIAFEDFKVTKKLKSFLWTCVDNINFRLNARYSTETEDAIYRNILKYCKCKLNVEVKGRHFILEKIEDKKLICSPQPSSTNTETSKTDKPISDKLPADINTGKSDDKTKEHLLSDSEMSAFSLKDYEVYDINLQDSFSDESNSDKSDTDGDKNQGGDTKKSGDRNRVCDKKDLVQNETDLKPQKDKVYKENGLENECKNEINKTSAVLSDEKDKISKDINNIDCKKVSSNHDLSKLNTNLNGPDENDTEKLLSLCKVNNVNDFLNDQDAKVSVSIDIKLELNSNKKFTKEELIEKIENTPDINIDLGLTNNLISTTKRSSEIFDITQSSVSKKSKINFSIAKITFQNNILITKETVEIIQKEIFSKINESNLPLLKFINYNEKSLNYRCDNEFSFDWLKNVIENLVLNDSKLSVTLTDEVKKSRYKMKAVLNIFLNLNSGDLLKKIELYQRNIKVDNWLVLDVEFKNNVLVYILDVDEDSYMAISDANFSLYCGIDAIEFHRCYD